MVYGVALLPACRAPGHAPSRKRDPDTVLPRGLWTGEQLDSSQADRMNGIRHVTIHHEGSPNPRTLTGLDETAELLERIRRYHVQGLGWADIGYHYVIDRAGRVWECRPIDWQGAHVRHHNEHNVGIMVLGNFEIQRPSDAQLERLPRFLADLRRRHGVDAVDVRSHREWAATACPGRLLQPHFQTMRTSAAF